MRYHKYLDITLHIDGKEKRMSPRAMVSFRIVRKISSSLNRPELYTSERIGDSFKCNGRNDRCVLVLMMQMLLVELVEHTKYNLKNIAGINRVRNTFL